MQAIIVGAGPSGVLHALAFRAAGVRISLVCDSIAGRARDLAEACEAHWTTSLSSAGSADAAIAAVCSPPNVHREHVDALMSGGRTIFLEKPVATSLADLAHLRPLPCVPILQWRAGRALRALRRAVAHGVFGPTPTVGCDLAWARDDAYFRARASWNCGAILSVGIHALDAIGWLLGRPIEAAASLTLRSRRAERETSAALLLRIADGCAATLRISLDGGADTTRITVCGNGVTASLVGGEADPTGTSLEWRATHPTSLARLVALERETPGALGSPLLVPYVGDAVAALRDGAAPGETQRLPSIDDCHAAHVAALSVDSPSPDPAILENSTGTPQRRCGAPTG